MPGTTPTYWLTIDDERVTATMLDLLEPRRG